MERLDEQSRASISLFYVKNVSDTLKRVLRPFQIRTVTKSYWTLKRKLVHPKDVVSEKERPNVVYRIPCEGCPATYVGQTKRRLEKG